MRVHRQPVGHVPHAVRLRLLHRALERRRQRAAAAAALAAAAAAAASRRRRRFVVARPAAPLVAGARPAPRRAGVREPGSQASAAGPVAGPGSWGWGRVKLAKANLIAGQIGSLPRRFPQPFPGEVWRRLVRRLPPPAMLLCVALVAANLESGPKLPPIISAAGRDALLRAADDAVRQDSALAEWHSKRGERLLSQMLDRLPQNNETDRRMSKDLDVEGLWLLCRTQLGAIEAALLELDQASQIVARVRARWQDISSGWPSMTFNYAVRAGASRSVAGLVSATRRLRRVASPAAAAAAAEEAPAEEPPAPIEERRGGLAPARTRLGLGSRRRALLRCERSLASHAGALHDIRVALREIGGEWLELGRWIGGPPLPSMPWDVQPSKEQCAALIAACGRAAELLRGTADTMERLGTFNLYREPAPHEQPASDGRRAGGLSSDRASLLEATRDALASLRTIRSVVHRAAPPRELKPPGLLEKHSLVWVGLVGAGSYALANGHHVHLPALWEQALRIISQRGADGRRFIETHVSEPIAAIIAELFHGTAPTIDPEQVKQTRESLARMLQDFVAQLHAAGALPGDGSADALEVALAAAADGSMEAVTVAYEQAVNSPISSLLSGKLLRTLLLLTAQLRLLMEEEVEAIDTMLRRNDFNLQIMATVPGVALLALIYFVLRFAWRRLRSQSRFDPLETIQVRSRTRRDASPDPPRPSHAPRATHPESHIPAGRRDRHRGRAHPGRSHLAVGRGGLPRGHALVLRGVSDGAERGGGARLPRAASALRGEELAARRAACRAAAARAGAARLGASHRSAARVDRAGAAASPGVGQRIQRAPAPPQTSPHRTPRSDSKSLFLRASARHVTSLPTAGVAAPLVRMATHNST